MPLAGPRDPGGGGAPRPRAGRAEAGQWYRPGRHPCLTAGRAEPANQNPSRASSAPVMCAPVGTTWPEHLQPLKLRLPSVSASGASSPASWEPSKSKSRVRPRYVDGGMIHVGHGLNGTPGGSPRTWRIPTAHRPENETLVPARAVSRRSEMHTFGSQDEIRSACRPQAIG